MLWALWLWSLCECALSECLFLRDTHAWVNCSEKQPVSSIVCVRSVGCVELRNSPQLMWRIPIVDIERVRYIEPGCKVQITYQRYCVWLKSAFRARSQCGASAALMRCGMLECA
jgi:hypothetical protein